MRPRATRHRTCSCNGGVDANGELCKLCKGSGLAQAKPSKYKNKKVALDGYIFDSMGEAERYSELKMLQAAGHIKNLVIKPVYPLKVNNVLVCSYEPDFEYVDNITQRSVTEDFKGVRTPVFVLKKKLMRAVYGIDILETKRKRR